MQPLTGNILKETESKERIMAAYIYKFPLFVEWPNDEDEEFLIGVLGPDHFEDVFKPVQGTKLQNHTLVIRHFGHDADMNDLGRCRILFISPKLADRFGSILEQLAGKPVLTVSESKGFVEMGGMINFVTWRNRVRFELNPKAAKSAGITMRSRFQRLALRIVP